MNPNANARRSGPLFFRADSARSVRAARKSRVSAWAWAGLVVVAAGCDGAEADVSVASAEFPVVYGEDGRRDLYQVTSPGLGDLASGSAVALIPQRWETQLRNGTWYSSTPDLETSTGVCSTTAFADQPSIAFCSGVLVDVDVVLTAAHCQPSDAACDQTLFVFDYALDAANTPRALGADSIYRCRRALLRDLERDIAMIQLDRPVASPRQPAPMRGLNRGAASTGDGVTLVGYPDGIPLKIDEGGAITGREGDDYLTSSDAFGGNSGSAVYDDQREVIGLLVAGQEDYVQAPEGCLQPSVLPETAGEEVVASIQFLADHPALAASNGECTACESNAQCAANQVCQTVGGTPRCVWDCGGACGAGETCGSDLTCQPQTLACEGADVWVNKCGRPVDLVQSCDLGEVCSAGACVPAPAGRDCGTPQSLAGAPPVQTQSPLVDDQGQLYPGRFSGSCGGDGQELRVYTFTMSQRGTVRIEAGSGQYDTVMYIRQDCADTATEVACNDDSDEAPFALGSVIDTTLDAGTYTVVVDTFASSPGGGSYLLSFSSQQSGPNGGDDDSGGCSTTGKGGSPVIGWLVLVGLIVLWRRSAREL